MDNIYPIGSVFITTNTTNPSTYFGGTWERIRGRFLLGADDSTYKIGKTGGEATHTLTVDEMPSHAHNVGAMNNYDWGEGGDRFTINNPSIGYTLRAGGADTGGNQPHNNMPPYLVVYIWKRIS